MLSEEDVQTLKNLKVYLEWVSCTKRNNRTFVDGEEEEIESIDRYICSLDKVIVQELRSMKMREAMHKVYMDNKDLYY